MTNRSITNILVIITRVWIKLIQINPSYPTKYLMHLSIIRTRHKKMVKRQEHKRLNSFNINRKNRSVTRKKIQILNQKMAKHKPLHFNELEVFHFVTCFFFQFTITNAYVISHEFIEGVFFFTKVECDGRETS